MKKLVLLATVVFMFLISSGFIYQVGSFFVANADGSIVQGDIIVFNKQVMYDRYDFNVANGQPAKLPESEVNEAYALFNAQAIAMNEFLALAVDAKRILPNTANAKAEVNLTTFVVNYEIWFKNYSTYVNVVQYYIDKDGGNNTSETSGSEFPKTLFTISEKTSQPTNFKSKFNNLGEAQAEESLGIINYQQVLGSPNKKLRSNATTITKLNGVYYHTWVMTPTDAYLNTIDTWVVYVNPLGWYYVTAGVVAVFFLIYITVWLYKKPVKNKVV